MRHPFKTLGLLVLASAGCDRLQDDPIFAYGRAELRDGSPAAGATLTYERAKVVDPPNTGGPWVYPKPDFTPYGTATTEASGDYFLEMRYGDVQAVEPLHPEYPTPYRYRVSLQEEDGSGTFVSFLFFDDVELPLLRTWDSRLTLTPGPEGHVVSFAPAPPAPEVPVTGEPGNIATEEGDLVPVPATTPDAVLLVTSGGQPLYRWWGATSPWTASPYILEDFASPEVQLRAMSFGEWWFFPVGAPDSYMTFRQEWRTAPQPLPAGTLRPVSRGVTCEPIPQEGPCPWTDGRLESLQVRSATQSAQWLTLTLPEPTRLRHAVVRGMSGTTGSFFILEGSLDGEQWSRLALSPLLISQSVSDRMMTVRMFADRTQWDSPFDGGLTLSESLLYGESALADVGPVRYVRLSGTSFANGNNGIWRSLNMLSEVSLFE